MNNTLEKITDNRFLIEEILKLKKGKNAIILAHYYQLPEIQDIADFIGDSLQLSQQAAATNADIIVFAGVHFMAETAKILNPGKKVIIPDADAGCSLADSCPATEFKAFVEAHPNHLVVSYINCTAEVKALSDIICTSSNAADIVKSIPENQPVIFAPDKHLGRYVMNASGRKDILLWDGTCVVHDGFSAQRIGELKNKYPGSKIIAHPECRESVLEISDFTGSTSALLNFISTDNANTYIVATESGILHQMKKARPDKKFYMAPPLTSCTACGECPYMKMNTLEKLYLCLLNELPEVLVPEKTASKALVSVDRMLRFSKALPLSLTK